MFVAQFCFNFFDGFFDFSFVVIFFGFAVSFAAFSIFAHGTLL